MARNRIEKQRSALRGLGIAALVCGLAAFAGGVVMVVFGVMNLIKSSIAPGLVLTIIGALLAIAGCAATIWGFYATWVGFSIKATKGSVAEDNLSKGTVNGKVCPKCGIANTSDATECQVCHTPLE
mgnify:CR=1 FL=1